MDKGVFVSRAPKFDTFNRKNAVLKIPG